MSIDGAGGTARTAKARCYLSDACARSIRQPLRTESPMTTHPSRPFEAIDHDKSTLDAARPLPKHSLATLREKLALEWTYHSNAIEGNTLTLRETKVVLEGITVGGKSLREHFEATNHRDAILYVEELVAKQGGPSRLLRFTGRSLRERRSQRDPAARRASRSAFARNLSACLGVAWRTLKGSRPNTSRNTRVSPSPTTDTMACGTDHSSTVSASRSGKTRSGCGGTHV